MNLIDRVKNILINPKDEWVVIDTENTDVVTLTKNYLIPLALIPAVASFIGFGLIGHSNILYGVAYAAISIITTVAGAFLSAFIINTLSSSFASRNDFGKAFQLVVYSYTPALVAGVFFIIPALGILAGLASLYGLYILYLGIKPMMQTPEDKSIIYFIVSLLVMGVVFYIINLILVTIVISHVLFMAMAHL
jgi:hypothetical protein